LIALSRHTGPQGECEFPAAAAELTDIENKIAARGASSQRGERIQRPIQQSGGAVAASLGFASKQFFEFGEERRPSRRAPQVKF